MVWSPKNQSVALKKLLKMSILFTHTIFSHFFKNKVRLSDFVFVRLSVFHNLK